MHLPCNQWSGFLHYCLSNMDLTSLHMHEKWVWFVTIKHSTKQHPYCGMGSFVTRSFVAMEVIEYYNCTHLYSDLRDELFDDEL